jgi:hypothetical protein
MWVALAMCSGIARLWLRRFQESFHVLASPGFLCQRIRTDNAGNQSKGEHPCSKPSGQWY